MKTKKYHPKSKLLLCVLVGIVLFSMVALFGLSHIAKEKYWSSGHLQTLNIDMERYAAYLDEIDISQKEIQDMVRKCNEEAVVIPEEYADFFHQCDQLISNYFQKVYSVDITDKLNALNVRVASYPGEIAETVGGAFSSELGCLFMNAALLDSFEADVSAGAEPSVFDSEIVSFKLLRNIYIHETIHYLGFADDPQIGSFMEAITEALTEQVTIFNGIKYENLTGYGEIKAWAAQIIEADPELVRSTLQSGVCQIGERIGRGIGDDYTEKLRPPDFMQEKGGAARYREIPYLTQYIVYEYIKTVQPPQSLLNGTVRAFELKWFLNTYS